MDNQYTPKHLKKWTHPDNYYGETWDEYYVFMGRSRDSSLIDDHNFDYAYEELSKLPPFESDEEDLSPHIVRERHWLCGWVEWIAIHQKNKKALMLADELAERLKNYPILDEDSYMDKLNEEAYRIWSEVFNVRDRINYIRRNGHYCSKFSELLATVRGELVMVETDPLVY